MLAADGRESDRRATSPGSPSSEADTARRQAVSMYEGEVVVSAFRLAKTPYQFR